MVDEIKMMRDELIVQRGLGTRPLPSLIERSWERCLLGGINSRDDRLFQNTPSRAQAASIEEEYRQVITAALPEMQTVLRAMSNSQWCVLVTDATGMIVQSVAQSQTLPATLKVITTAGKRISEGDIGTTAPGCALIEHQPVRVDQRQHFLDATRGFVCAAAPIFDRRGNLAGVLDLSGVDVVGHAGILDMVALSAQAIENRLVLSDTHAVSVSVRFHYRRDMLDSPRSGLLTFSSDGVLVGANNIGRQLLSLGVGEEKTFEALFDGRFGPLSDLSRQHEGGGVLFNDVGEEFAFAVDPGDRTNRHSGRRVPSREVTAKPAAAQTVVDSKLAETIDRARRAFAHDVPVLVSGETGTGKEVFARSVHAMSDRRNGPFVAVDCSAISPSLIEAELFGYEDGAFTGARRGGSPGKIAAANKGTLFLDEIGDMPLDLQTRLLRVVQERTVTRVGGVSSTHVDFGLISATNCDLRQMVEGGTFRQDLYYRIRGLVAVLPALRLRDDLDLLIEHFLSAQPGSRRFSLSPQARALLHAHRWPGNIRELQQVLAVCCALADDDGIIHPETLPPEIMSPTADNPEQAQSAEQAALQALLEENAHNVSAVARRLGIARTTLYRRLRNPG